MQENLQQKADRDSAAMQAVNKDESARRILLVLLFVRAGLWQKYERI
jgi:hypothetical protein